MILQNLKQVKDQWQSLKYNFFQFDEIYSRFKKSLNDIGQSKYEYIAIIGFGASLLNLRCLATLAKASDARKIIYLDSLDLANLEDKLDRIIIDKTAFLSISHSGNTHETYFITKYLLEKKKITHKNLYIIAPTNNNLLFQLAKKYNTIYLGHQQFESGRFAIISSASLLFMQLLSYDIEQIISHFITEHENIWQYEEDLVVEIEWYLSNYQNGKNILVNFNYSWQIKGLILWQQQLLAESLGKNNFGFTPIIAKGSFDEHSQLQLYLDGPDNKFYKISYIKSNHDLADLQKEHLDNIHHALAGKNREIKLIEFEELNTQILAQEIFKIMIVVITIARIQNLNPFDQPIVDFHKKNYNI